MNRRTVHRFALAAGLIAAFAAPMLGCKNTAADKPEDPNVAVYADPAPEPEHTPAPTPAPGERSAPQMADAPHQLDPQTDPEEVEGWRPQWWLEDPMKTQQHAVACAYATDPELSKARTLAVDHARQRLAQTLGREARATEMKTDALKLPSGEYRAFVLIQTQLK